MANKTATVKATVAYTDADGRPATIPEASMAVPYQAQLHTAVDVPDTTAAGDFVLPFGSIAGANMVLVTNGCSSPINVSVNGGDLEYTGLAPTKSFLVAAPMLLDTPITAITCSTTETQSGDGQIGFHVFGDPVAP